MTAGRGAGAAVGNGCVLGAAMVSCGLAAAPTLMSRAAEACWLSCVANLGRAALAAGVNANSSKEYPVAGRSDRARKYREIFGAVLIDANRPPYTHPTHTHTYLPFATMSPLIGVREDTRVAFLPRFICTAIR